MPFVLLTNGGGVTEAIKAAQVSEMLDLEVRKNEATWFIVSMIHLIV